MACHSLIGRSADKLDALAEEHGSAPILVADCAAPESIAEAFKGADADMSSIAAYAYCAGSITLKPVRRASLADFREAFDLNTLSAVEILKAIEKPLKKNKGLCVLFSTIAVQQGLPNHAVVSAAKGAVEGLTRALAAEYAASGVRFNAVAPSLSKSAMAAPMLEKEAAIAAALAKAHPLGRLGEPDDLAALADFLLSHPALDHGGRRRRRRAVRRGVVVGDMVTVLGTVGRFLLRWADLASACKTLARCSCGGQRLTAARIAPIPRRDGPPPRPPRGNWTTARRGAPAVGGCN